jgi:hypothetical protein
MYLPKPELARIRTWVVLVVAALVTAVAPQWAAADGGTGSQGVHVDPGSPTGKQYQIPINTARQTGGGGGGSGGSGSGGSHLFGAGISSGSSGSGASSGPGHPGAGVNKAAAKAKRRQRPDQRDVPRLSAAPVSNSPSVSGRETSSTGGTDGWLPLIGGGAAVLLLGCGGGLALRRRLASS